MQGTPFGRYRLTERLGHRYGCEVWRAYDTAIDRVVVLKMLDQYARDETKERFRREACIVAHLDDPHVVPIYEVAETDGRLHVAMRQNNGADLETLLGAGPLAPARAVAIIEQVAAALHAAHERGLVHRNVHASKILLSDDDFASLIFDFGVSLAGELDTLPDALPPIDSCPPERFTSGGGALAPAADIYSLACVLYRCLTGQPPFPGLTLDAVLTGHLITPPPKPSQSCAAVPAAMDGVIATGLAKEPGYRYRTTRDLAAAARAALATAPPQPFVARAPISTWNFSLVLVRLGRRILLVHERKHGQLWYLPAGRVEPGETFATAARRETLEEAGIDVVLEGVLRIEHTPLPVNTRMRVVFVGRPADDRAAKSIPDDESLGAAWFTLDEMAGLPLRSEEVRKLARQVLDGPFIHPMSLFASE